MGRPAKTAQELWVTGGKSASKAATDSHVPSGRPKFPRDLDPSLKRIFKQMCSLLAERRALSRGDVELIRIYCFAYDRHRRNVVLLRSEGEITTYFRLDSNGKSVPQVTTNLRLKICVEAEKQMTAVLTALGMTPTAKDRARPTAPEAPPADEVIPGSMGELYAIEAARAKQMQAIPFVNPADMTASDEPEEGEPNVPSDGI